MVGVWAARSRPQPSCARSPVVRAVHLVALRRLRCGEAAGLTWSDLDPDAGILTVTGQLRQLGGGVIAGPPKSEAGRRVIAFDATTVAALRAHRSLQHSERAAAGNPVAGHRVRVHHPNRNTGRPPTG